MNRGKAPARGGPRPRGGSAAESTDQAGGSTARLGSAGTPGTTARRGAATSRATRAPSVGRFRPKAIRRDEADRDVLARQEEQKARERAAEERRAHGRSRNESKRSRGDAMGSRGRGTMTASGPFSGGFAGCTSLPGPLTIRWAALTFRTASGRSGGFGGLGGGGGYGGGGGRSFKSEGKGFGEADGSRRTETRINADKLHVNTPAEELGSDDEATMAAMKTQTASTLPMGIYRREHKEQGVVVATTAELEAAENANGEEESLWVDGEESAPPAQLPEEGVWDIKADKKVQIKQEPGCEDKMDLDTDVKRAPGKGKQPALKAKPKKEVAQDAEERTIQEDMQLLASELGAVTVTEDGETKTDGPADKDGRLYLFQFPPLLPPLRMVSSPQSKVKEERGSFGGFDAAPVDLTREEAGQGAGTEAAADEEEEEEDPEEAAGGFRSQLLSQGGMIGKLNVRRSGKVELDWGGMTLEMSPAAGMNFLTTAVIVEENDEKAQHDKVGGEAVGMGKIMGRFILAPIWSDEEEWNVAPEDLVVE